MGIRLIILDLHLTVSKYTLWFEAELQSFSGIYSHVRANMISPGDLQTFSVSIFIFCLVSHHSVVRK